MNEPKLISRLVVRVAARIAKANTDPRVPKGHWQRWRLFFVTLAKCIPLLPAVFRGARVTRAIEREQKESERERLDRIRNPDRWRI